jgi:hypothetical protein
MKKLFVAILLVAILIGCQQQQTTTYTFTVYNDLGSGSAVGPTAVGAATFEVYMDGNAEFSLAATSVGTITGISAGNHTFTAVATTVSPGVTVSNTQTFPSPTNSYDWNITGM